MIAYLSEIPGKLVDAIWLQLLHVDLVKQVSSGKGLDEIDVHHVGFLDNFADTIDLAFFETGDISMFNSVDLSLLDPERLFNLWAQHLPVGDPQVESISMNVRDHLLQSIPPLYQLRSRELAILEEVMNLFLEVEHVFHVLDLLDVAQKCFDLVVESVKGQLCVGYLVNAWLHLSSELLLFLQLVLYKLIDDFRDVSLVNWVDTLDLLLVKF